MTNIQFLTILNEIRKCVIYDGREINIMKRVLVLPLLVVLLFSFSSFGESTKNAVKSASATITTSSNSRVAKNKTRAVKDKSGNWSKIKSLFL